MNFLKLSIPFVAASTIFVAGCEVEQTREGELPDVDVRADAGKLPKYDIVKEQDGRMPDVDVDVHGGQLPKYDIDGPSVSVGKKKIDVNVPDVDFDVDVRAEEKSFSVPTIDVDLPEDEDNS